ncbi:hypothetical protein RclHR1_02580003 [Rhizophagus clarus]|uniref:Uncharacterized protein n=1 Tax=Rhizophagus clarus TaxID=94130 RepID=A0A2Z6R053_9GLOM|nr:hypothetical protein RclHR1_02580003 [Rhizophagus clarus]
MGKQFVFTYLLDEGYKQLANMNGIISFHLRRPHVINYAPSMLRRNLKDSDSDPHIHQQSIPEEFPMLRKNLNDIEDLILNKRFVPFPPRPKAYQLDSDSDPHIHQQSIPEEFPMLRKNLNDIEDLILNKRFVPFPPRPKAYQDNNPHIHQQPIPEE